MNMTSTERKKSRKSFHTNCILVSIFLISLLIRYLYYVVYPVPWRDAYHYKTIVEECISENQIPSKNIWGKANDTPPLPLYIVWKAYRLFGGDIFHLAISIEMILGSALVCLLWFICKKMFYSKSVATVVSFLAATNPRLLDYSTQFTRDGFYLFFVISSFVLYIYSLKQKSLKHVAFSALFVMLSIMCRYEGVELILIYSISYFLFLNASTKTVLLFVLSFLFMSSIFFVSIVLLLGCSDFYFHGFAERVLAYLTDYNRIHSF